jgi:pimeloyl-ACP methyl ester carboxylesterase
MKSILYLHGFASSPGGRKVTALRGLLEPRGFRVVAPDLNVPSFQRLEFAAMVRIAVWESRIQKPLVIVGSSLGALLALEASRRGAAVPLLLIAPALGFGPRWTEQLPPGDPLLYFHHGQEKEMPIHRAFFEEMAKRETDVAPPSKPVVVMMGGRDESVPPEFVRSAWRRWESSGQLAPGSRYIEIPEGDHGLVEFAPRIAEEIVSLAAIPPP